MLLCNLCLKLGIGLGEVFDRSEDELQTINHHPSQDALISSARGGCQLCSFFEKGLEQITTKPWRSGLEIKYRWALDSGFCACVWTGIEAPDVLELLPVTVYKRRG